MRLNVRFSIPSTQGQEHFRSALTKAGFHIDSISPSAPGGVEITAYVASGYYTGTWEAFFDLCKDVARTIAIDELTCSSSDR